MGFIFQTQYDIMNELTRMRKDISEIRRTQFDLKPVGSMSAIQGIVFNINKKEWLYEIGALPKPEGWEYGYYRTNENNARVNTKLKAIEAIINEMYIQLQDFYLKPKTHIHSEIELSRFEVIEGGCRDSWLVSRLKEGAVNG